MSFSCLRVCVGREADLRPAEKRSGWHELKVICLRRSLQTSWRTSCASAGLAMQTASVKPGLRAWLAAGPTNTKSLAKYVLAELIPGYALSYLPQPWSHRLRRSQARVHAQARQKEMQSAQHCLEACVLVGPASVAG